MAPDPYYTFRALSCFGAFALWGNMMLNGSFMEMVAADLKGVFPSGTPLKTSWTGIGPVDFMLGTLLVFFSSVINTADLPDLGPYLISVDLIGALMVVNMMTVVEDRRNRKTGPLRSTAFWQTLWNCFGAATILPAYCHVYLEKRGKKATSERISQGQAQALPLSALWEVIITLPLLLPTLLWDDAPLRIQYGIILWGLGPFTLSLFQDLVSSFVTSGKTYKGFSNPVTASYWILGILSGALHVGCIAAPYFGYGMSWKRIYWPNHSGLHPGPTLLIEGATMFCQYDYIIVTLSVLALGSYMLSSSATAPAAKSLGSQDTTKSSTLALYVVTFLFGPGTGLAWLLCDKENKSEQRDSSVKT